jgi:hypothetical protein
MWLNFSVISAAWAKRSTHGAPNIPLAAAAPATKRRRVTPERRRAGRELAFRIMFVPPSFPS